MDNHIHVLLRNRPDLVERWSDEQVMRRACRLFVFDGWLTPIQVEGDGQEYPAGLQASEKGVLSMSLDDYLELLEWTARELHREHEGAIPGGLRAILERLGLQERAWLACIRDFRSLFKTAIGSASSLARHAQRFGHRWLHGSRRVAAVSPGTAAG